MEQLTTYRAKGKEIGLVFLFKYDLNGNLKLFEICEGILNNDQMKWLYSENFPATEPLIKVWIKNPKFVKHFDVDKSLANLSFEALWNLYNNKVSRMDSEKCFKKLKEADVIKCFLSVPQYLLYLQRKKIAQAHLSTYINKRYFDDDYSKV